MQGIERTLSPFCLPAGRARRVHVELGDRSYDIHVGVSPSDAPFVPPPAPSSALLVADGNAARFYAKDWEAWLRRQGVTTSTLFIPPGEASKSIALCENVWKQGVTAGLDRGGIIAALGGGVVGDLAGFAAATFLRGVRLVQIPTTLLAMVDSSVGGKTAVNLESGKNLVGAFHQPSLVLADIASLASLPLRQLRSGMAEVVKYGAIADAAFFDFVQANAEKILGGEAEVVTDTVVRCCRIKAGVVQADECEGGRRAVLNFGHTLGHALEKCMGYGKISHGEAVALGMVYAAKLSREVLGLPDSECRRLKTLLERLGLPVTRQAVETPDWEELRRVMAGDKKSVEGTPRFVLLERLGEARFGCKVDPDLPRRIWMELE